MSVEIHIPKLGMSMKEATLTEWKFNEGERVNEGDVVLVIETDKTSWEVQSPASGYLHILVAADRKEPVGAVVGMIAETPEDLASMQGKPAAAAAPKAEAALEAEKPAHKAGKKEERGKVSPLARKMAEEKGIDLNALAGSGPGGRIVKKDIEEAIAYQAALPAEAAALRKEAVEPAASPTQEREGKKIKEILKLRGMRKAIADHMVQSLRIAAQLSHISEAEVTGLVKFREQLLANEEQIGVRISYTDLYVKAAAKVLKDAPGVNASIIDDEIILWEDINIGVAVALQGQDLLGGGLIVPVIRNADKKSLSEISLELKQAVKKAREGNLMPDDVSGGTFTLSSTGTLSGNWGFGTPIINQPESAILQISGIMDRAVVREDQIVIRPMVPLSFTFDHRVLDGASAGLFIRRFAQILQDPILLI